ncbi:MAG: hypothetical protein ACXVDB_06170 [Tumebacillaceae bacterium]
MEESWLEIISDTMGIVGNVAECIGLVFLFSQLRRSPRVPVKQRRFNKYDHQQRQHQPQQQAN